MARKHKRRRHSFIIGVVFFFLLGSFSLGKALFIPAKAFVAQIMLERAWQAKLEGKAEAKPWRWADFQVVAKLEFPQQKKSRIVLSDGKGESLAFGPSHLTGTPYPGFPGVTVIAAHRDTHFAFFKNVKIGDEFSLTTKDNKKLHYRIIADEVVLWDNSMIDPYEPGYKIALVTCWPLNGKFRGDERYILWAELVSKAA